MYSLLKLIQPIIFITFMIPLLLILIIATAEMSTSIYTPSLTSVATHFNISESLAQWTVSINLLGLALSGPIYGPWSDCHGRRTVLRIGMTLFLLGSIFALFANSIEILLIARFIQGLGEGVAVVIAFAIVRDLFDEKKSAQVLSYMGMAIALSPGLAPILGGFIAHTLGWKMCFGVVSFAAAVIIIFLFLLMPETLPENNRSPFSVKTIAQGYLATIKNTRFLKLALIPALMIGGLWAWMAGLPLLFIGYLGVPLKHYGYYGLSSIIIYIIGTFLNSKLVHKIALKKLLFIGLCLALLSSIALLIAGYIKIANPIFIQILNFPFAFGLAFVLPNGTALAFSEVKKGLGTSSALLGSLEMASGALSIFLVGQFFHGTILSIASIMLGTSLLSISLFIILQKSCKPNKLWK